MTSKLTIAGTAAAVLFAGTAAAQAHSADEVFDKLQNHGYTKIVLTDSTGLNYMANACRDGGRYHFHVNNYGHVTKRRRIGYCGYRDHRADRHDDDFDSRYARRAHNEDNWRSRWRNWRRAN